MAEICRICEDKTDLVSIFQSNGGLSISQQIMTFANVKINKNDKLPQWICSFCIERLRFCYDFKLEIERCDTKLRSNINNVEGSLRKVNMLSECNDTIDSEVWKASVNETSCTESINSNCKINIPPASTETTDLLASNTYVYRSTYKKKPKRKFQCCSCGKIVSSSFLLRMHLRIHSGEKPFLCSYCNKAFTLLSSLKSHERVHTKEKPLKCETCDLRFSHHSGLASHRRLHTGEKPYKCNTCSATFRTASQKIYHVKKHQPVRSFVCIQCDKSFYRNSDLQDHIQTHSTLRKYVCNECAMSYKKISHLNRHIRISHDKTHSTHKCNVCKRVFKNSAELTEHEKFHDNKEEES